jgi:hypothetical protein
MKWLAIPAGMLLFYLLEWALFGRGRGKLMAVGFGGLIGLFAVVMFAANDIRADDTAACSAAGGVYFSGRGTGICLSPDAIRTPKESTR